MFNRIWDPQNRYNAGFLKEYQHWVLEVSYRQHTLGCFIIFAKRQVENISELTDEEMVELRKVMLEMESALSTIPEFKPDRFNYLQMGNALHHLHLHGIPRYASTRNFLNNIWEDQTWGKPPLWKISDESSTIVRTLREKIVSSLKK